jgi:hypothetical protein
MNLLGDTTAPELTEEMGAMAESTTEGTGAQAAESTEEMTPPVAGFVETDPVISPLIQWKEISQFDWKEREKKNVYEKTNTELENFEVGVDIPRLLNTNKEDAKMYAENLQDYHYDSVSLFSPTKGILQMRVEDFKKCIDDGKTDEIIQHVKDFRRKIFQSKLRPDKIAIFERYITNISLIDFMEGYVAQLTTETDTEDTSIENLKADLKKSEDRYNTVKAKYSSKHSGEDIDSNISVSFAKQDNYEKNKEEINQAAEEAGEKAKDDFIHGLGIEADKLKKAQITAAGKAAEKASKLYLVTHTQSKDSEESDGDLKTMYKQTKIQEDIQSQIDIIQGIKQRIEDKKKQIEFFIAELKNDVSLEVALSHEDIHEVVYGYLVGFFDEAYDNYRDIFIQRKKLETLKYKGKPENTKIGVELKQRTQSIPYLQDLIQRRNTLELYLNSGPCFDDCRVTEFPDGSLTIFSGIPNQRWRDTSNFFPQLGGISKISSPAGIFNGNPAKVKSIIKETIKASIASGIPIRGGTINDETDPSNEVTMGPGLALAPTDPLNEVTMGPGLALAPRDPNFEEDIRVLNLLVGNEGQADLLSTIGYFDKNSDNKSDENEKKNLGKYRCTVMITQFGTFILKNHISWRSATKKHETDSYEQYSFTYAKQNPTHVICFFNVGVRAYTILLRISLRTETTSLSKLFGIELVTLFSQDPPVLDNSIKRVWAESLKRLLTDYDGTPKPYLYPNVIASNGLSLAAPASSSSSLSLAASSASSSSSSADTAVFTIHVIWRLILEFTLNMDKLHDSSSTRLKKAEFEEAIIHKVHSAIIRLIHTNILNIFKELVPAFTSGIPSNFMDFLEEVKTKAHDKEESVFIEFIFKYTGLLHLFFMPDFSSSNYEQKVAMMFLKVIEKCDFSSTGVDLSFVRAGRGSIHNLMVKGPVLWADNAANFPRFDSVLQTQSLTNSGANSLKRGGNPLHKNVFFYNSGSAIDGGTFVKSEPGTVLISRSIRIQDAFGRNVISFLPQMVNKNTLLNKNEAEIKQWFKRKICIVIGNKKYYYDPTFKEHNKAIISQELQYGLFDLKTFQALTYTGVSFPPDTEMEGPTSEYVPPIDRKGNCDLSQHLLLLDFADIPCGLVQNDLMSGLFAMILLLATRKQLKGVKMVGIWCKLRVLFFRIERKPNGKIDIQLHCVSEFMDASKLEEPEDDSDEEVEDQVSAGPAAASSSAPFVGGKGHRITKRKIGGAVLSEKGRQSNSRRANASPGAAANAPEKEKSQDYLSMENEIKVDKICYDAFLALSKNPSGPNNTFLIFAYRHLRLKGEISCSFEEYLENPTFPNVHLIDLYDIHYFRSSHTIDLITNGRKVTAEELLNIAIIERLTRDSFNQQLVIQEMVSLGCILNDDYKKWLSADLPTLQGVVNDTEMSKNDKTRLTYMIEQTNNRKFHTLPSRGGAGGGGEQWRDKLRSYLNNESRLAPLNPVILFGDGLEDDPGSGGGNSMEEPGSGGGSKTSKYRRFYAPKDSVISTSRNRTGCFNGLFRVPDVIYFEHDETEATVVPELKSLVVFLSKTKQNYSKGGPSSFDAGIVQDIVGEPPIISVQNWRNEETKLGPEDIKSDEEKIPILLDIIKREKKQDSVLFTDLKKKFDDSYQTFVINSKIPSNYSKGNEQTTLRELMTMNKTIRDMLVNQRDILRNLEKLILDARTLLSLSKDDSIFSLAKDLYNRKFEFGKKEEQFNRTHDSVEVIIKKLEDIGNKVKINNLQYRKAELLKQLNQLLLTNLTDRLMHGFERIKLELSSVDTSLPESEQRITDTENAYNKFLIALKIDRATKIQSVARGIIAKRTLKIKRNRDAAGRSAAALGGVGLQGSAGSAGRSAAVRGRSLFRFKPALFKGNPGTKSLSPKNPKRPKPKSLSPSREDNPKRRPSSLGRRTPFQGKPNGEARRRARSFNAPGNPEKKTKKLSKPRSHNNNPKQ